MKYPQESFRPATLLKRDSNTNVFLWILQIFKNSYFDEHLLTTASDFFKTATEQQWSATSVLTLFLSSGNLLTGYEQLSY